MRALPRRAFSTDMTLPHCSVALSALMAASASSLVSIVTNANPRDSLECGSYMTDAFWTWIQERESRSERNENTICKERRKRTRPTFMKMASRSRFSTLGVKPDTCRLLPGLLSLLSFAVSSRPHTHNALQCAYPDLSLSPPLAPGLRLLERRGASWGERAPCQSCPSAEASPPLFILTSSVGMLMAAAVPPGPMS